MIERLTRRDFLRGTVAGAGALALGVPFSAGAQTRPEQKRTRVVLIRDERVVDTEGRIDSTVLEEMLDRSVAALLEMDDAGAAWKKILRPGDTLGIKSNEWEPIRTPPDLEEAIGIRALAAGIAKKEISVDDRGVLGDPVFRRATALINVRPLRTHHWSGIGGCIKNYIMFSPDPPAWHDDSCADLGGLWKLPICARKTRLNILLLLTPQFHGVGPHHFDPAFVWPYKGMLVSADPVAVDALGVELLAEKRKRFFDPPPRGGTSTKHVRLADTRHGIGVADRDRIDLVRIGWMDDSLI